MKGSSSSVRRRNRRAALNRAARNVACECPECRGKTMSVSVPRPLVVAYEGAIGIAVISGEFVSPDAPPLYTICMVHPSGSVATIHLQFVSPHISDIRRCLSVGFAPDGLALQLVAVCDLLPPDLSHASPWDVGALDLALCLDGPLTMAQRASISQARALCDAGSAGAADGQRVQ